MMTKGHVVTTATIVGAATFAIGLPPTVALTSTGVAAFGAILPDIDHPKSKASKMFPRIGKLFQRGGHRTYTHTIWAILFLLTLTLFTPSFLQPIMLALTVGYFLHIAEDALSMKGVNWLHPFKKRSAYYVRKKKLFHIRYRVGGNGELIFTKLMNFFMFVFIFLHIARWITGGILRTFFN